MVSCRKSHNNYSCFLPVSDDFMDGYSSVSCGIEKGNCLGMNGAGDNSGGVSTGTTIIACCFDGGVVLGADTRTSAGQVVVNRAARKISRIHDKIFVCRSGSAADTQAITQIVKLYVMQHAQSLLPNEQPKVNVAASLCKTLCYEQKDMLTAGLIVAGYDKERGPQIYSIPLGGTKLRVPFVAGGSGSVFVTAFLDSNYKPNMNEEECVKLVGKAVAHAIIRDGSSGGLIRIIIVTQDNVRELCYVGDKHLDSDLNLVAA